MDRSWALLEVQLAVDEVDRLFGSRFDSELMMIGQGPSYCRKVSRTFEGRA